MSNETKEWNDSLMQGIEYSKKVLDVLSRERSQLYGTIIHLMITNGVSEFEYPQIEVFKEYGEKYYILFNEKDGKFTVSLLEQEHKETS